MAARRPCPAGRASAADRRACGLARGRRGIAGPRGGVQRGAGTIGLDRGTQCADRHPLGDDQCRRPSQTRGRIGCVDAGCPRRCQWHHNSGGITAGDPYCADRVCDCGRPGRRRFRRELGAAGRQRDRVPHVRIRPEREMAGTAQADRAGRDASGGPAGSGHRLRDRTVWRPPVRRPFIGVRIDLRSTYAMQAKSNAPLRHSGDPRMVALS